MATSPVFTLAGAGSPPKVLVDAQGRPLVPHNLSGGGLVATPKLPYANGIHGLGWANSGWSIEHAPEIWFDYLENWATALENAGLRTYPTDADAFIAQVQGDNNGAAVSTAGAAVGLQIYYEHAFVSCNARLDAGRMRFLLMRFNEGISTLGVVLFPNVAGAWLRIPVALELRVFCSHALTIWGPFDPLADVLRLKRGVWDRASNAFLPYARVEPAGVIYAVNPDPFEQLTLVAGEEKVVRVEDAVEVDLRNYEEADRAGVGLVYAKQRAAQVPPMHLFLESMANALQVTEQGVVTFEASLSVTLRPHEAEPVG